MTAETAELVFGWTSTLAEDPETTSSALDQIHAAIDDSLQRALIRIGQDS